MSISAAWSQGYVTDTLYTDNIYREEGPAWINYVAALGGCVPRPLDAPFSYLELGCGLGHSIAIFAAAFPEARFVGVDFNPAHIDLAQRRARELGLANLTYVEASFQDLAADAAGTGLARGFESFDFIALHGIYSWVSVEARAGIQRLIFDRLKPGGLVYNSYNCLPGWAAESPVRRLAMEFARVSSGLSSNRARDAFARIDKLAKLKSGYFAQAPQLAALLGQLAKKPGNYLAHEYLNGDWNAFYAADVADEMGVAKLDFVGSATLMENHADLLLNEAAKKMVDEQPEPRLKQMMQDFLTSQKFRRDVFVRGHAHLSPRDRRAQIARQVLVAPKSLAKLAPTFKVPRGTITFDLPQFDLLKEVLGEAAASELEFGAAFTKGGGKASDFARLLQILTATGHLQPAARSFRPAPLIRGGGKGEGNLPRQRLAQKANSAILAAGLAKGTPFSLASPVSGNAAPLGTSDALILQECFTGGAMASLVERVQAAMIRRGIRLAKDGKPVTEPDAATAHLTGQVETFLAETLPALRRLGVVESA